MMKDKKVLITGGSLGIGKATAQLLIEAGAQVAITGRNEKRLIETAKEIGAFAIQGDVSIEKDRENTFTAFLEQFGSLDILINNAAFGWQKPLLEITEEDMRSIWETNVLGATMMAQKAAKLFVTQNSGDIVNIASTAGLKGYKGGSAYSSSKFALRSLSECWRAELRPHNIRIITVNPSAVTTAFGSKEGIEREDKDNMLRAVEIAHVIKSSLDMDPRGFVPEVTIHATNPF